MHSYIVLVWKCKKLLSFTKVMLVIVHYSPRLFLPYHENFKIFNVFEFLYSLVFKSIPQIFSKVNLRHWGQSCILKEFLVLIMIFKEKMKKMKKYHSFKIMMNI